MPVCCVEKVLGKQSGSEQNKFWIYSEKRTDKLCQLIGHEGGEREGLNDEQLERQSWHVLQWARLAEKRVSEVKGTESS